MNRSEAVRMVVEAAGIKDGVLYISGPNADMNTTGLVEYNIRFDSGSIDQRELACRNALRLIPGVVEARLTRTYKTFGGIEVGRRIKICFGDRSDGSTLDSDHPVARANRERRARRLAMLKGIEMARACARIN